MAFACHWASYPLSNFRNGHVAQSILEVETHSSKYFTITGGKASSRLMYANWCCSFALPFRCLIGNCMQVRAYPGLPGLLHYAKEHGILNPSNAKPCVRNPERYERYFQLLYQDIIRVMEILLMHEYYF